MRLRPVLLLTMLTLAVTVSADNLGFTKEKPLLFSLDNNYAPMQSVNAQGEPLGYDVEFTEELMDRLHIPMKYMPNTWEMVAEDVMKGRSDLAMMVFSPYRKDEINYSRAVFRLYYQLVYRKGENNHNGLRDISGKTIALMKSRPIIDTLTKAGANYEVVSDLKSAFEELAAGKYDGVICFRYQARYLMNKYHLNSLVNIDLTLMPREYCYVSHNKALIEAIDKELEKMESQGITERIYSNVKTYFDKSVIPIWIWYLLAALLLAALVVVIVLQRHSHKQILREMLRAQQSEQLKDIFLSNLSHALRTPLNAIIGFSDLMMTTPQGQMPEDEQAHLLGLINSNGLQLLHLINELLSLSDIEGKNHVFDRQVTDVDAEMSCYANETRQQLTGDVTMDVVEPIGGLRALIDSKLLRVVTMHLLDNARENTAEGKMTLTYYAKQDGLYVEVKDTGCGLPEKLKENIFTLLSDKNTYLQEDTPGLGLSICKAIIDKTGGQIGVKDNEDDGRGTIVWFWVPAKILN